MARYWPIVKPHNRTDRDCEAQIFKVRNEGIVPSMSILALYERLSFGILSSSLAFSEEVIVRLYKNGNHLTVAASGADQVAGV